MCVCVSVYVCPVGPDPCDPPLLSRGWGLITAITVFNGEPSGTCTPTAPSLSSQPLLRVLSFLPLSPVLSLSLYFLPLSPALPRSCHFFHPSFFLPSLSVSLSLSLSLFHVIYYSVADSVSPSSLFPLSLVSPPLSLSLFQVIYYSVADSVSPASLCSNTGIN